MLRNFLLGIFALVGLAGVFVVMDVTRDREVVVHTMYRNYDGLAQLKEQADLVVYGEVQGQVSSELIPQPGYGPETADTFGFLLPTSTFAIRPLRVLQGSAPDSLNVMLTGGPVQIKIDPVGLLPKATRTFVAEDSPLLKAGERHLLFLIKMEDGRYSILGGPQGRAQLGRAPVAQRSAEVDEQQSSTAIKSSRMALQVVGRRPSIEMGEYLKEVEGRLE